MTKTQRLEQRIRKAAAKKLTLRITTRSRSRTGFIAIWADRFGHGSEIVRSKAEALAIVLETLNAMPPLIFSVKCPPIHPKIKR